MKLPTIKELVGPGKIVRFSFYREGELWYETVDPKFEFPIPPDDMRGAIFRREDKAILFMRFIRKHLDFLTESMKKEGV